VRFRNGSHWTSKGGHFSGSGHFASGIGMYVFFSSQPTDVLFLPQIGDKCVAPVEP
jgi:hypothetical protein